MTESYHFTAYGEEEIFTPRKKVSQPPSTNPWRFHGKIHGPFNKVLKIEVFEPHVHNPSTTGGVRPADYWEIPK